MHLARLNVKARVIVLTDAEGLQGESWTIQCEIIEQQLLGAVVADEEMVPVPDAHGNRPMFNFFGLGQLGAPPFAQRVLQGQIGAQNAQVGNAQDDQMDEVQDVQEQENFVDQELMEVVLVPQHVFGFDLNDLKSMFDLNILNLVEEEGLQPGIVM
jgi:hypothetical protein